MARRGRPPGSKNKPKDGTALNAAGSSTSSSSNGKSNPTSLPAPAGSAAAAAQAAATSGVNDGGVTWVAICVICLTFLPKAFGSVKRSIGVGGRRDALAAFQGGKGGGGLFNRLGHAINTIGSRLSIAGAIGAMVVGVSIAPLGTFQRYHTAGEVPGIAFRQQTSLSAQVIRITDGDTLRVRHTPLFPVFGAGPDTGKLSDETIVIRLAGVDAPETAKANQPGQPYAAEAKQFVKDKVLNQQVRVKLLRRDQYARAVATIRYGPFFFQKDLGDELLKEGLAVMYTQKGAEYDGRYEQMKRLEMQARFQKKGIWSKGDHELPSQYKARQRKIEADRILAPAGA